MWDKFASIQGIEIEKALESGTYPTILTKRILATSFQGLSLTTRHDSSIELNPTISLATSLEEWKCSNAITIRHALEKKQFEEPLSVFVSNKHIGPHQHNKSATQVLG
ncbi:unnamed protein product [Cuscuta campestris]|uniref:Uncharacterized protein n=1 Tax=Cuscuta campestris TaxID=132261 RepID=A0A484KLB7_9ASTE|nr:unnamed protein product [Cuscuta campestris]